MEALHKGECLGSKYEKIQGLGQKKSRHILHTMQKEPRNGKRGKQGEMCLIRKIRMQRRGKEGTWKESSEPQRVMLIRRS